MKAQHCHNSSDVKRIISSFNSTNKMKIGAIINWGQPECHPRPFLTSGS